MVVGKAFPLSLVLVILLGVQCEPAAAQVQPVVPFPSLALIANNPSKPYVQVVPYLEAGRAFVKLQNGFHEVVRVKSVFLEAAGKRLDKSLLGQTEIVAPGESRYVDVTDEVRALAAGQGVEGQGPLLKIRLDVKPEPPEQQQYECRVRLANGRLVAFSLEEKAETSP